MTRAELIHRFKELAETKLERPGSGRTIERHRAIVAAGREDLSLAKLIEAHWDAVSILEEADRHAHPDATYAVWASELPGSPLRLRDGRLNGTKAFCSGGTIVDRALVTAGSALVEIDLHSAQGHLMIDEAGWHSPAFRLTSTATLTFEQLPIVCIVGEDNWYTQRSGFWKGACGPAAAWAGGAAALFDHAKSFTRNDPHTLAHVGAMSAAVHALSAVLDTAGRHFDDNPQDDAMVQALSVRHIVEQLSMDILTRFGRAFGPAPLVLNAGIARRCSELELFLRQSHAERDLEVIGRAVQAP